MKQHRRRYSTLNGSSAQFGGIFEPDILIREAIDRQKHRSAHQDGERRLMLAVLQDAIECFQDYAFPRNKQEMDLFSKTYEWFMSPEERWLYSFENICLLLDFDPNHIREGLKKWRAESNPRTKNLEQE